MIHNIEPITEEEAEDLRALFGEAGLVSWQQLVERVRREFEEDARERTREALERAGLG